MNFSYGFQMSSDYALEVSSDQKERLVDHSTKPPSSGSMDSSNQQCRCINFMVIGSSGSGKSSFCNQLHSVLGKHEADNEVFPVGHGLSTITRRHQEETVTNNNQTISVS